MYENYTGIYSSFISFNIPQVELAQNNKASVLYFDVSFTLNMKTITNVRINMQLASTWHRIFCCSSYVRKGYCKIWIEKTEK